MVKFFKSDKKIIEEKVKSLTLVAISLAIKNDRNQENDRIDLIRGIIKEHDDIMSCLWHLEEPELKGIVEEKQNV